TGGAAPPAEAQEPAVVEGWGAAGDEGRQPLDRPRVVAEPPERVAEPERPLPRHRAGRALVEEARPRVARFRVALEAVEGEPAPVARVGHERGGRAGLEQGVEQRERAIGLAQLERDPGQLVGRVEAELPARIVLLDLLHEPLDLGGLALSQQRLAEPVTGLAEPGGLRPPLPQHAEP